CFSSFYNRHVDLLPLDSFPTRRSSDLLSGSMVRNITTSVALYKVSFNFGQLAYFFQQMLFFPVFTQSINVWMLNKQKYLVALMFRVAFIPLYLLLLIH